MKCYTGQLLILILGLLLWSCGKKDVDPQLPGYLRIPASLPGYTGSGLVTIDGNGLNLRAEGPEEINSGTKTYSGVSGTIYDNDIFVGYTLGQPLPYDQSSTVPAEYRANGWLIINNTFAPGTYPMGIDGKPTPTGVIADVTFNLPGPQLYYAKSGSLTISESTLIKASGDDKLYRVRGTFNVTLDGTGVGITAGKTIDETGTFDLLLLSK